MPDITSPTTILVVDDHPMLRAGVTAMVDFETDMTVIGEAADGAQAVELFNLLRPDITLMDIQMPGINGIEAITKIREIAQNAVILVLTTYSGDAQALRAIRAGAKGYILKSSVRKELVGAIRTVASGERFLPPIIAQDIAFSVASDAISEREIAVLELVASGNANKQIAFQLSISEATVKSHLKNIFIKLDAMDRAHAVTLALRRGIISF